MNNTILVEHAFALVNNLQLLRVHLKVILDRDGQRAMTRGFSPISCDLGPLSQWIYVIDTHLAAKPVLSPSRPGKAQIRNFSNYIVFLTERIQSDSRFVGEISLDWSPNWLEHGKFKWHAVLTSANAMKDLFSRNNEEPEMKLSDAMISYFSMQSPRD